MQNNIPISMIIIEKKLLKNTLIIMEILYISCPKKSVFPNTNTKCKNGYHFWT